METGWMKASLQFFGQQAQSREAGHEQKPFRTTLQGLGPSLQWQVIAAPDMALTVYSPQPPISLFCFSVPLPRG